MAASNKEDLVLLIRFGKPLLCTEFSLGVLFVLLYQCLHAVDNIGVGFKLF